MARTAPAYRGGAVVRGGYVGGGFYRGGGGFYRSGGFYRPYYTFRPRLSLGFGLWLGYPVAWPSFYDDYPYYDYPYAAPYPYPYGYGYVAPSYGYSYPAQPYGPAPNSTYAPGYQTPAPGYQTPPPSAGGQPGVQPAAQGGVSFQITPDSAAVLVDGAYVGTAGMFGPTSQPLGLAPGRHHIEIRADGYRPMTFDADITPGQVLPYQGEMQRQ